MEPSYIGPSGPRACSISACRRQQQPSGHRPAPRLALLATTALLLHLSLTRHAIGSLMLILAALQAGCAIALVASGGERIARRLVPLACCLVLPAALLLPQPAIVTAILVSHLTLYAGLALLFGGSLLPGRKPLVTRIAEAVEPRLTGAMRAYTRGVTWLWALYGPAQIALSLLLLAFASLHAWSVFVNLLDLPLLLALFVGEYAYRRWRLRGSTTASLRDTLRAASRGILMP